MMIFASSCAPTTKHQVPFSLPTKIREDITSMNYLGLTVASLLLFLPVQSVCGRTPNFSNTLTLFSIMTVANVQGSLEITTFIAAVLHGVLIAQVYSYFTAFPDDPRFLKITVIILWLCTSSHLACSIWGIYTMTISSDYNIFPVTALPVGLSIAAGFGAFVHSLVQVLYALRIYKLAGNICIPIICWATSAYDIAAGIVFESKFPSSAFELQSQYIDDRSWLIYSVYGSTAAVDVLIAVSLCYYLRNGARTGMNRSVRLVDTLIIWTVETGLVTSLVAIAGVIIFAVHRQDIVWIGLYIIMGNLYPITFVAQLALLNGRTKLSARDKYTFDSLHFATVQHQSGDDGEAV